MPKIAIRAKERLSRRLVVVAGTHAGYIHRLRRYLVAKHGETATPSVSFLRQVVNGTKNAPLTWVADIVRYVERDPDMPYERALELAPEWFDMDEGALDAILTERRD